MRGAKGAVPPPAPAASFQVAELVTGPDGMLSPADQAALRDVARLQKRTGGVVRVEGAAAEPVRQALVAQGVPSRKIRADAGPDRWDGVLRLLIEY